LVLVLQDCRIALQPWNLNDWKLLLVGVKNSLSCFEVTAVSANMYKQTCNSSSYIILQQNMTTKTTWSLCPVRVHCISADNHTSYTDLTPTCSPAASVASHWVHHFRDIALIAISPFNLYILTIVFFSYFHSVTTLALRAFHHDSKRQDLVIPWSLARLYFQLNRSLCEKEPMWRYLHEKMWKRTWCNRVLRQHRTTGSKLIKNFCVPKTSAKGQSL